MTISSIALTAGIMSLTMGCIGTLIIFFCIAKYLERKQSSTLILSLSMVGWVSVMFFVTPIYLLAGTYLTLAIWFQKMVYVMTFVATILTFLFARQIFFDKMKKAFLYVYLIIGSIVIIVVLILDSVDVTVFPDGTGYPLLTIKFEYSILVVLYIFPTMLGIFIKALITSRKIEETLYRIGFRIIALGQIMLLTTFIFDTLATVFIDNITLYALFLYLTWIPPILALICYYVGWIMPDWFRKHFA